MSIDFDAVCHRCRKFQHVGQHMGGVASFGYGSRDLEGMLEAAKFAIEHAMFCGEVVITRDPPEGYLWVTTDPMDRDEPGYGKGGVVEEGA